MAKSKLTTAILETIELCAADEYTLEEIRKEADITTALMQDPQVLEAIERGRVKQLIEIAATDGDLDHFIFYSGKSMEEISRMIDEHEKTIEAKRVEVALEEKEKKKRAKYHAHAMLQPEFHLVNLKNKRNFTMNGEEVPDQEYYDEFIKSVKNLRDGKNEYLLRSLMAQLNQLQTISSSVNMNIYGSNDTVDNFVKFTNLQVKLMQEQRRTVMAIDDLMNPKKTVFVKKAEQHLHQTSEKNIQDENELQQLEKPEEVTEAELFPVKEKVVEEK